jgi:DNA-binding transcriptional ArsR family regulator
VKQMSSLDDQIEGVIFQALAHEVRRSILKMISSCGSVSYTELTLELGLSTGKLNYHLEQLEGLIEKNADRRYVLTPFGKKALNQLNLIKTERSVDDEKYVKTAERAQKIGLQPAIRAFLLISIAFSSVVLLVWGYVTFIVLTEGAPIIMYILMPILLTLGVILLGSLIYALKRTPNWIKRFERKFLGPD